MIIGFFVALQILTIQNFQFNVSFKYVKNYELLRKSYDKQSSRLLSGKFITIYPNNENQFLNILYKMDAI